MKSCFVLAALLLRQLWQTQAGTLNSELLESWLQQEKSAEQVRRSSLEDWCSAAPTRLAKQREQLMQIRSEVGPSIEDESRMSLLQQQLTDEGNRTAERIARQTASQAARRELNHTLSDLEKELTALTTAAERLQASAHPGLAAASAALGQAFLQPLLLVQGSQRPVSGESAGKGRQLSPQVVSELLQEVQTAKEQALEQQEQLPGGAADVVEDAAEAQAQQERKRVELQQLQAQLSRAKQSESYISAAVQTQDEELAAVKLLCSLGSRTYKRIEQQVPPQLRDVMQQLLSLQAKQQEQQQEEAASAAAASAAEVAAPTTAMPPPAAVATVAATLPPLHVSSTTAAAEVAAATPGAPAAKEQAAASEETDATQVEQLQLKKEQPQPQGEAAPRRVQREQTSKTAQKATTSAESSPASDPLDDDDLGPLDTSGGGSNTASSGAARSAERAHSEALTDSDAGKQRTPDGVSQPAAMAAESSQRISHDAGKAPPPGLEGGWRSLIKSKKSKQKGKPHKFKDENSGIMDLVQTPQSYTAWHPDGADQAVAASTKNAVAEAEKAFDADDDADDGAGDGSGKHAAASFLQINSAGAKAKAKAQLESRTATPDAVEAARVVLQEYGNAANSAMLLELAPSSFNIARLEQLWKSLQSANPSEASAEEVASWCHEDAAAATSAALTQMPAAAPQVPTGESLSSERKAVEQTLSVEEQTLALLSAGVDSLSDLLRGTQREFNASDDVLKNFLAAASGSEEHVGEVLGKVAGLLDESKAQVQDAMAEALSRQTAAASEHQSRMKQLQQQLQDVKRQQLDSAGDHSQRAGGATADSQNDLRSRYKKMCQLVTDNADAEKRRQALEKKAVRAALIMLLSVH
mmetsp:Transcript_39594/g.93301  ORF Transcript_39594/g.93301 Transcript_39594/m.93301 type:complete len:868 (-) Transcript_39594:73-2676(-)